MTLYSDKDSGLAKLVKLRDYYLQLLILLLKTFKYEKLS